MTRAINIDATADHIMATCAKRNVRITAIEGLLSGGTRVVTSNAVDCATIVKAYGRKVITGVVERVPLRVPGRAWPVGQSAKH